VSTHWYFQSIIYCFWRVNANIISTEPKRGRPRKKPEERIENWKLRLPMQCDECGKILKGILSLRYHKASHANIRPYSCSLCGKGVHSKLCGHLCKYVIIIITYLMMLIFSFPSQKSPKLPYKSSQRGEKSRVLNLWQRIHCSKGSR